MKPETKELSKLNLAELVCIQENVTQQVLQKIAKILRTENIKHKEEAIKYCSDLEYNIIYSITQMLMIAYSGHQSKNKLNKHLNVTCENMKNIIDSFLEDIHEAKSKETKTVSVFH